MTKRVTIEYKDTWTEISVPKDATILQYGTPDFPEIPLHPDPERAVKEALENPIGMERLPDLVKKGSKVTIAFDDPIKHPESIKVVIPIVVDELTGAGVREEDITLLCASGAHCKLRPDELRTLLGPKLYHRFRPFDWEEGRILNHDCTQGNVYLGETSLGDKVVYNKAVMESDQLIYVGTVYPLPYGGYGGQGVVIGLAGMEALRSLHSYDVFRTLPSLHGDYRPEKNPYRRHKLAVHERIEDATGKRIFYVDALTGPQQKIVKVFAGHVPDLERTEYPEGDRYYRVKVPEVDIIVVGLPYTLDYDSSDHPASACNYAARPARAWWNKPVLRKNGVIIALGQCKGMMTPRRPGDVEALGLYRDCFSAKELYDHVDAFCNNPDYLYKYRYEYAYSPIHSIFMMANIEILQKVARQTIFAGEVNPGLIREIGAIPSRDFDEALALAKEIVGGNPNILVLPRYLRDPKPIFEVIS
ncbi:MAG: lactate racemase domain-containing protein [Pseudomonadota bacterium]